MVLIRSFGLAVKLTDPAIDVIMILNEGLKDLQELQHSYFTLINAAQINVDVNGSSGMHSVFAVTNYPLCLDPCHRNVLHSPSKF